jgi:hypothetical protein
MQSIRRTVLAVIATLVAIVISSSAAVAATQPVQPDTAKATPGGGGSSGGFLDSWPQVTLSLLVAAVLALVVYELSWQRPRVSPVR